ncbi:hypothetical protein VTN31DRAFT_2921 [Thermomyces dupontii]|uniref:uncharacterized protein n=1 Tax=Talaromyces thermophilus TaxID=28565 RepID=UPI0037448D4C
MASYQSSGLNVIALISGGKDSLYSILHCIRNGHRVVALANLHPPLPSTEGAGTDNQQEDMDSFMYQTIGHRVIPLYEQALGLPLYRAPITGGAVDTSRIYGDEPASCIKDDETESLVPLLSRIMRDHPEANAVSAGAILSTYQRTRIENVAGRLGLVPLAWLWMYPSLPPPVEREGRPTHAGLLEDMAAAGCDSRIIKVSSGGLDSSFLWENVADRNGRARDRIVRVMKRFVAEGLPGAVLGEGGEYETLAIDGPRFLWKNKIVIEQEDRQVETGDGGVSFLSLSRATVVPKEEDPGIDPQCIRRPQRLDPLFARALHDLEARLDKDNTETQMTRSEPFKQDHVGLTKIDDGNKITISNVADPQAGTGAGEQMRGIVAKLRTILKSSSEESSPTTNDIVFATVLLRSMKDFAQVNGEYASLFTRPNPAARVTVACGDHLPEGVQVMASFVVDRGPRSRREGLHVQSRSYWAPANIGPYSQAISIPLQQNSSIEHGGGLVFVAGQIPLDPASMEIAGDHNTAEDAWHRNFGLHATLSLQHLWRIGTATKVDWWLGGVAFLASDPQHGHVKARIATDIWKTMNRKPSEVDDSVDEDGPDAWDIRYGGQGDLLHAATQERRIPNYDVVDCPTQSPPVFTVEVQELPRGSDIEWQGIGLRGKVSVSSETLSELSTTVWTTVAGGRIAFYNVEMGLEGMENAAVLRSRMEQILTRLDGGGMVHMTIYTTYNLNSTAFKGQIIPCGAIWGSQGQRIAAVMMLRNAHKE